MAARLSSYLYDTNGIRIRKTIGSTVTEYFTNGSTILAEKTGSNVIWYIYDSDGEILGFTYNGTPYYYIKNVQGDVYKVVNASGTEVASYTYDAWGKVLSATGSMANVNPIRYRSYYYDTESGLYYLSSRYYDPEVGRFISADGLLGANQDLLSYNLFAYCSNNPVNCSDPTGQYVLEGAVLLGIVAAAFLGTGIAFGTVGAQIASQQLHRTFNYNPPAARHFPTYNEIVNNPAIQIAPNSNSEVRSKEEEKDTAAPTSSKKKIVFPLLPAEFCPRGLTPVPRGKTKNGLIITWMDPVTNIAVFSWHENPNFSNGPHYHISSLPEAHFYAGETVPEPWASLYFGEIQ